MFALFNPPKGSKKSKRAKKARRRKLSAYARYVKGFKKKHPKASFKDIGHAWKTGGKGKKHRKAYKAKGCVRRASIGSIVARRMSKTVCNMAALKAARARYCKIGAPTGIGALARTESMLADSDRVRSASELRTPGGARIFGVANNRRRDNPMRKHRGRRGKGRGLRLLGFNVGAMSVRQPSGSGKIMDAVSPKNLMGVMPVVAGVIANSMLTGMLAGKIPMTKGGVGNYALGIAGAGVVGGLGSLISADVGSGAFIGGVVEVVGRIVKDIRDKGFGAISLSGLDDDEAPDLSGFGEGPYQDPYAAGFQGMGEFITPRAIQAAIPSESTQSQYALPQATAQNQYQQRVLAEMIGGEEDGGF